MSRHGRRLVPIDFGTVEATCPDAENSPEPLEASGDPFAISRHGRFSGDGSLTSGNEYHLAGIFLRGGRVRGTVVLLTREDCTATVHFTARIARRA